MLVASTILRWPGGAGSERRVLRRRTELTVQRQHAHAGNVHRFFQRALHAAYLGGTGQEAKKVALMARERSAQRLNGLLLQSEIGAARNVVRRDLEGACLRRNDRRLIEQAGERLQIQRGGHDQDAQVLAQRGLTLDAQRQAEIGIQAALVKFVEDHAADILQFRIGLQHARENSLGDDLDPGGAAHACLEPRAKAHGLADGFIEQLRHARGDGSGRNAARLEHHDFSLPQPRAAEDGEWDDGALSGPRRSMQQHTAAPRQRVLQPR